MELKFEYNKKTDYLSITPEEKKYYPLCHLEGKGWESSNVEGLIDIVHKAKEDKNIEDFTIDGITGFLWVFPDIQKAQIFESGIDVPKPPPLLLELSLNEVLDFLNQLKDFLESIGK